MLPNGRTAYLDLAYPDCRLDIEIDHSEWHATASAVEQDKARDLGLALLGWERLRFTERADRAPPAGLCRDGRARSSTSAALGLDPPAA